MTDRIAILKQTGRLLLGAAFFFVVLWTLLAWRAHGRYQTGRSHQAAGRMLEAAREYQTAIGFYAPLNPWSRSAAVALGGMVRDARQRDPALAFELEDRFRRSVEGIRWLVRPYRSLLAGSGSVADQPPKDPSPWLFFLALAALAGGGGVLFLPRRSTVFRAAAFAGGLVVWALALYLC